MPTTLTSGEAVHSGASGIKIWYTLGRRNPGLLAGFLLLLPFLLFAALPSLFSTHDPIKTSIRELYRPPSPDHFFGTDELGRDVYSRVVYGARISLASAALIIGIACLIGMLLGTIAGYWGGWSDRIIMTLVDLVLAFPSLILALAVSAALGPGLRSAIIAAAAVWWPVYARLLRGITLQLAEMEYVTAARAMGASAPVIIRRHILPNAVYAIIVRISIDLGLAVLLLASLSFIGLGASAPTPEWGAMVAWGRLYFLTEWWIGGFPALAVTLVVVGITMLGDGLNDLRAVR
ncbi:MAG: ABC transporter permease [Chloroflexota bacterium]|nr:ABC transporter permease [Chloroflexota bacterium]MDE2948975.1 ABC transporter permease [Chloroflexota bacterium]